MLADLLEEQFSEKCILKTPRQFSTLGLQNFMKMFSTSEIYEALASLASCGPGAATADRSYA